MAAGRDRACTATAPAGPPPRVRSALCQGEDSRQGAVWARVAGYEAVLAPSPTGSLLDHLDEFADGPAHAGVKPLPAQRGVILGVGGQPLLMEIFGSTQALATHLPPLLAALCLDAALVAAADIEHVPSRRARRMGTFGWAPGEWTDDTSMALVIAQAAATSSDLRDAQVQD